MPQEIEKKYLVKQIGPLPTPERERWIRSSYLATGDREVRVSYDMNVADSYKLTIKSGSGLVRDEVEFAISTEEGQALFDMVDTVPQIEKTRLHFGPWEYDIYEGRFDGLLVLEIELESESSPLPLFPTGLRVLADVTDNPSFKNQNLATMAPIDAFNVLKQYQYLATL